MDARPTTWAEPLPTVPGVTNAYAIAVNIYRGARPTAQGILSLASYGVRTFIDLEAWFDFNLLEWLWVKDLQGVLPGRRTYKSIPCSPFHPEAEDVAAFLAAVKDQVNQPIFFHCRQGSDRTGMMAACYRIAVQGWTKAEAIDEMCNGGFGFHGDMWPEIVPFIQNWNPA